MKLTSIFLLALLALSVFAVSARLPSENSTSTSDDWDEKTDIQHQEHSSSRSWRTEAESYKLQANEYFEGSEREVTDGQAAIWTNVTEHVLRVVDGKIVNTTETRRVRVDSHKKIQKIKTIIRTQHKISDILVVVRAFAAVYGQALSAVEFKLLNTIIMTDANEIKFDYEIKQIWKNELRAELRELAKLFTVALTEQDFAHWEYLIARNCSQFHQVIALDTSSVEVHRPDSWVVKAEVLFATCGDHTSPGYQLFAWAASKSGSYHRNQYSVANSVTVDALVTRWLYSNMACMAKHQAPPRVGAERSASASKSASHSGSQ